MTQFNITQLSNYDEFQFILRKTTLAIMFAVIFRYDFICKSIKININIKASYVNMRVETVNRLRGV